MASGMSLYDNAGKEIELTGENLVLSDVSKATGAERITNIIKMTKAKYDAITSKDPLTMYVIVG